MTLCTLRDDSLKTQSAIALAVASSLTDKVHLSLRMETQEVCFTCFRTSCNAYQRLSFLDEASRRSRTKKCSVCRIEWRPVTIVRQRNTGGPWKTLSARPDQVPPSGYALCHKQERCQQRFNGCKSLAHSSEELAIWNSQARLGPRVNVLSVGLIHSRSSPRDPPNVPWVKRFYICRSMMALGRCTHGSRCTYPHSEAEQKAWNASRTKGQSPRRRKNNSGDFRQQIRDELRRLPDQEVSDA